MSVVKACKERLNTEWTAVSPIYDSVLQESDRAKIIVVAFKERYSVHQLIENTPLSNLPILVYVGVPRSALVGEIIEYGKVRGVFYKDAETWELERGLQHIARGEMWFSRHLSNQLLFYFNSIIVRHAPPHKIYLTQRETQVLKLLRRGSTNTKLADSLCLSEHTVKSHLYRIYKKLQVNNRQQAAEWAHHYLEDSL
jgi:DNA-binding NarL/FixJ family response regulator